MRGMSLVVATPLLVAVMMIGRAAPARAEITVAPFVGAAFGGNVNDSKITYGLCLGLRGDKSAFGLQVDLGLAPDVLSRATVGESSITTLMANLLVTAPREGSRIYASAGVGILKARAQSIDELFEVDSNEFGFNVGAGVDIFLGRWFGLRGDIRYFRALTDPQPDGEFDLGLGDLDFWRATGGLILRF